MSRMQRLGTKHSGSLGEPRAEVETVSQAKKRGNGRTADVCLRLLSLLGAQGTQALGKEPRDLRGNQKGWLTGVPH